MMTGVEWNQKTTYLCSFLESHLYHTKPDRGPDVSRITILKSKLTSWTDSTHSVYPKDQRQKISKKHLLIAT